MRIQKERGEGEAGKREVKLVRGRYEDTGRLS